MKLQNRQLACGMAMSVGLMRCVVSRESALPGLMNASPEPGAAAAQGTVTYKDLHVTSQPARASAELTGSKNGMICTYDVYSTKMAWESPSRSWFPGIVMKGMLCAN